MKLTSAQKAEKIREAAEEVIARLKQWEAENHAPNPTQIEEEVLAVRQQFGEALVTVLVVGQDATRAEQLVTAAGYFRHHQLRMNYLEMRAHHWPIGSGAENLLSIPSAVLSARFDHMWADGRSLSSPSAGGNRSEMASAFQ